jgi:hypothetical protein
VMPPRLNVTSAARLNATPAPFSTAQQPANRPRLNVSPAAFLTAAPAPFASATAAPLGTLHTARSRIAQPARTPRDLPGALSPIGAAVSAVGGWLGVPVSPGNDPGYGIPPAGDKDLPTLMTTMDFVQGHLYLAGIASGGIPESLIAQVLGSVPGFTPPTVYPITGSTAGPYKVPSNAPPGADYVVVSQRTGGDVQNLALPPSVLWVVDTGAGAPPAPKPAPGQPGAAPSDGKILGMAPTTLAILAGVVVVGVVVYVETK